MKNNKGFTLVELLAVIVILMGISLVSVSAISASLERRGDQACQEQIELAKNAAKIYFSLTNRTSVSVNVLKDGYFSETSKTDLLYDDSIVKIDGNKYIFDSKHASDCKDS